MILVTLLQKLAQIPTGNTKLLQNDMKVKYMYISSMSYFLADKVLFCDGEVTVFKHDVKINNALALLVRLTTFAAMHRHHCE